MIFKKIVLSTLSQLEVMIFKTLLFMCGGAVINRVKDYQDIRIIGV